MRSKNAFRNLIVSLAYEVVILALGLIVPRFIILSYGDSINGLTQTINRLLTLVNLLQAGAVGASIFQMFKPVADEDYETQSAVMYSSRRFFNRMGVVYIVIISLCSVFYGLYLQNEQLSAFEIIVSFLILAINGSLYFFFTSRYDIVFSSYQKKYLLTIASFVERIVYYTLLFLVAFEKLHFILMYVALLIGGIIRVLVNTVFYYKLVGGKIHNHPQNKRYIIKDRKFLMFASIGDQAVAAAPTVIVTTFIGLAESSVFSIYSMIYISMKTLINSLHHAVSAIFGNLVTTSDDKKIASVFNILVYMFVVLGTFLASCTAFLFMDFIALYSRGFTGVNYNYPLLAELVVVYIAVFAIRIVFNFVANSYGLFKLTCKASLVCGGMALVISTLFTILFGMPYVMTGAIFYELSSMCILIYAFKKQIAWFRTEKWIIRALVLIFAPTISWLIRGVLPFSVLGWLQWVLSAVLYAVCVVTVLLAYSLIFERKEFASLMRYTKQILHSKRGTDK